MKRNMTLIWHHDKKIRTGGHKRRLQHGLFSLALSLLLLLPSIKLLAYYPVQEGVTAPTQLAASGIFNDENTASGEYKEATNSFNDGNPTYYLITQDPDKSGWSSLKYNGVDYPLAQVFLGSDLGAMKVTGDSFSIFDYRSTTANRSYFIDDGSYNDPVYTNYTGLSKNNLSLVGLNKTASGEPTATLTRSPYPGDYSTAAIRDMVERYNLSHPNIYFENIIFDGQNKELLPLGGNPPFGPPSSIGKNRGEYMFFLTSGSDGFVMRDCILQNVGADNSTQPGSFFNPQLVRKNIAINIYRSTDQHNLENLILRNIKTKDGFGIISSNQANNNHLRNITIVGDNAHANSRSVKVEVMGNDTTVMPLAGNNIVFDAALNLPTDSMHDHIYVQDNRYRSVNAPTDYRYAVYSQQNGSNYTWNSLIYKDLSQINTDFPKITTTDTITRVGNLAILDLKDNSWVVRETGDPAELTAQIKKVLDIVAANNAANTNVPAFTIKIVADSSGQIGSFAVNNGGNALLNGADIRLVGVAQADDLVTSHALIQVKADSLITLPASGNTAYLYNFDFHALAKYSLQEAVNGIAAAPTLEDPAEVNHPAISGYPYYNTYAPSSFPTKAYVLNSTDGSFMNCRFTTLAAIGQKLLLSNTATSLAVGDSLTPSASITAAYTSSDTGIAPTVSQIDDPTINWFSSDPTIATVDASTGKITGIKEGKVTIYAKSMDQFNQGEVEKPFASFELQINMKWLPLNTVPTLNAEDQLLQQGASFDPLAAVSAADAEDGDLSSKIEVISNNVNTAVAGTYQVSYKVTDSQGASTEKTITVIVNAPPVITATNKTLFVGDTFNPLADVTASDPEDGDLSATIKVTQNTVDSSTPGTYQVSYEVTDSQGATTNKTIQVVVLMKQLPLNMIPTITATDRSIQQGSAFDPLSGVSANDTEDGDLTAKIEIVANDVNPNLPGTYHVSYKVTDSQGASYTTSITVTVTPLPNTSPSISASDRTLEEGDSFDPLTGVSANDQEDGDLTAKIEVVANDVKPSVPGTYHVTYKVTDSGGLVSEKTITVIVKAKTTEPTTTTTTTTSPTTTTTTTTTTTATTTTTSPTTTNTAPTTTTTTNPTTTTSPTTTTTTTTSPTATTTSKPTASTSNKLPVSGERSSAFPLLGAGFLLAATLLLISLLLKKNPNSKNQDKKE